MLQEVNGTIQESQNANQMTAHSNSVYNETVLGQIQQLYTGQNCYQNLPYTTYWNSYPVYVCSDKTKKAIEVLKVLQAEKLLKCDSVPRFIELVEKIAGLL